MHWLKDWKKIQLWDFETSRTSSENVILCFCNHFSLLTVITLSKGVLRILQLNWNQRVRWKKKKWKFVVRCSRRPHRDKIRSLSNHDDDGTKNTTNLYIWQWKTVFLHALHVHFSSFDILKTFSFFLRREMTCFAVVWTTWAYDNKCSILSSYVLRPGSNLIPG